jgi:membrane associated rhomboid family serine protease
LPAGNIKKSILRRRRNMFPLRDDNPTSHFPFITLLIILANALAWVLIQGLGFDPALTKSVFDFGLIPGELLRTVPEGTTIPISQHLSYIIEGEPNWKSVVTSMFMHGGWFHILGNMWFLKVFGDNVEDSMGSIRFIFFYLFCGIAAAGTQIALSPGSLVPMVGASGAISGVMGAYALLYPRAPIHTIVFLGIFITKIVVPAYVMLGYWFVLQILSTSIKSGGGGGVAFGAHIGGFVAGVVLIFLFRRKDRMVKIRSRGKWKQWR